VDSGRFRRADSGSERSGIQRGQHGSWILVDHSQQSASRRFWGPPSSLPVLDRFQAESKRVRESGLRHAKPISDGSHVNVLGHMYLESFLLASKESLNVVKAIHHLLELRFHAISRRYRKYYGPVSAARYRWFLFRATPSFDSDGRIVKWFGTSTDIDDRKRAEHLLAGENLVLEMTAKGDSLESVLEALCRVVEQTASGCLCSVLLFDPSGSKIQQAVAPNLPSSYNDQFPGIPIDRECGPCTQAARSKTQVIVSDLDSDTRWDTCGWRASALKHGLKACWSTIILASNGLVMGTFAIYWREPRRPTEQDQKIIAQITHLASVAIERERNEEALRQSEQRFRVIVDTIPGFVFTLSAAGKVELLNRQALEYFGQTIEEWKNSPNLSMSIRMTFPA
jgi:PAS domain-containing protein